ncbi:MAG: hypothetical protein MUF38_01515 [Anaerolineae bacterium]|jgi:hypothetical protein|nr:hypothetical protein [Anaerolineae bacterium]
MREVTVQWLCQNPDAWWHGLNESGKFPRAFIHGVQLRHCLRPFWFEADQTSCVVIPQDYELHSWRAGMSDIVELFDIDETIPTAYHCGPKIGPDGNVIPDTTFRMGPRGTTIHPVLARELAENIRDWHNTITSPANANKPYAYIEVEGVLNRIVHVSDWRPRHNTIDVSYQPNHLLMGVYSNLCKPDDVLWLESTAPAPIPTDSPVNDDAPGAASVPTAGLKHATVAWLFKNEFQVKHAYMHMAGSLREVQSVYERDRSLDEVDYTVTFVGQYPDLKAQGGETVWIDNGTGGEGVPAGSPVDDDAPDGEADPAENEMWDYVRQVAAAQVARAAVIEDRTPNILAPMNTALIHAFNDNPLHVLNQGEIDRARATAREMCIWGVWDGFTVGLDIINPQHVYDRVLMGGMRHAHIALEEGVHYRFVPVNDDLMRATTPPEQRWRLPRLFGEVA